MIEDTLKDLRAERDRLRVQLDLVSECIVNLERLADGPVVTAKRRGRKSMDDAQRAEVAERMKRYWSKRRDGGRSMTAGSQSTQ